MEIKSFKEWLAEEQVKATYEKAPGDKAPDKITEPEAHKHDRGASGSGDTGARKEHANQLENGDKTADKIKEPKEHKIDAGKGPESANKTNNGQKKADCLTEAKGKLQYEPKHSEWAVVPKLKGFVEKFPLESKDKASNHAKQTGGKLIKLDQHGREMR